MGIGLAICRSIIEAHGGTIRATNSSTGTGAWFQFKLPIREPGAAYTQV
jgi:K+-sensing histidine kinase KdpD